MQSQIIGLFETIGVTAQEAKAYISLLKKSGVSGYQLSKNTGIPSSKIYSLINRLIERGFAIAVQGRPVKYFPRPPQELLNELHKGVSATFMNLEGLLTSLESTSPASSTLAWNITGRQGVIAKAKELVREAEDNVFLATWSKELRPLRRELAQAHERGAKVRVLAYGPTNFDCGEVFFHRPSDYPFRERGERRFVITVDNERAVIANLFDDDGDTGLWTENLGLVLLFRDFVIHEIYITQVEKAYPREIQELAGRDWEKLRFF
jgi:sugar-specific transcriptional regulator TrmB